MWSLFRSRYEEDIQVHVATLARFARLTRGSHLIFSVCRRYIEETFYPSLIFYKFKVSRCFPAQTCKFISTPLYILMSVESKNALQLYSFRKASPDTRDHHFSSTIIISGVQVLLHLLFNIFVRDVISRIFVSKYFVYIDKINNFT